jgi:hypothetical protein
LSLEHEERILGVSMNSLIQSDLTPAVATITVGILTFVGLWLKDLNAVTRRKQILEEAKGRVEFWNTWSTSISDKRPLTEEEQAHVERELKHSAVVVSNAFLNWPVPQSRTATEYREYFETVDPWRRIFWLYIPWNDAESQAKIWFWVYLYAVIIYGGIQKTIHISVGLILAVSATVVSTRLFLYIYAQKRIYAQYMLEQARLDKKSPVS